MNANEKVSTLKLIQHDTQCTFYTYYDITKHLEPHTTFGGRFYAIFSLMHHNFRYQCIEEENTQYRHTPRTPII